MTEAIPVVVNNLTPTFWSVCVLIIVVLAGAIKQWPSLDRQKREGDASLRSDLLERVDGLEERLEAERRSREAERARHDAERALDRHRLNNVTQCLDALLLLLEAAPERASEAVTKIKEMRAKQMEAEALEKATIRAADIVAKTEAAE
jgi:hypothetical protein